MKNKKHIMVGAGHLLKLFVFCLLVGVSSGCKEEEVPEKFLEVDVGSLSLNFDAERSNQTVTIRANVDFSATSSHPEWCSTVVMNYAADNLGISVLKNDAFDGRQATITVSADGMDDIKIAVTQSGLTLHLSVVQSDVLIYGRLEFTLDIHSNIPIVFDLPDWISEKAGNNWINGAKKYSFAVAQYLEDTPSREGIIKIGFVNAPIDALPVFIPVTQISEGRVIKTKGNSIQISVGTFNSLGYTPEELIADLKKADIKTVHYYFAGYWDGSVIDGFFRREYMQALKDNGIGIWLMLLGQGFSDASTPLPESWLSEVYPPSSATRYSQHNDDYVNWQAERVQRIINNYPEFMGIEFAESYMRPNGDVSPFAREKFTKEYLKLDRETLSFDEISSNAEWVQKWQEYGVDAIINFNQKIKEAVKSTNPDVLFAAWGIGWRNASPEQIGAHYWGLDNERIVKEVNPDIFFLQTSWQDWMDTNLQPQYISGYSHIVDVLQKANPNVLLGVQADIASLSWSNRNNPIIAGIRDGVWWKKFMDYSLSIGYYTNTAYDYAFYRRQGLWIE